MSDKNPILEVYLKEYDKLKSEQTQRIGFRDNLLYVTLGVFGTVVSFAVSNISNYHALLVVPWVCLILGWTYVVNDEKISAIGRYIRLGLINKIVEETGHPEIESVFGWEIVHRSDRFRKRRKLEQLIVDEITFVVSGIVALVAFWVLVPQSLLAVNFLAWVELLLLLALAVEIAVYADLAEGR